MPAVTKFRIAIYGILFRDGQVLMTETKVPSGVVLNFPGGGLELGEGPADALKREFVEETGMAVSIGKLLYATRLFRQNPDYPTEQLFHVFYEVTPEGETSPNRGSGEDIVGIRWVTAMEMDSLHIMPADREFIESAEFGQIW